MKMRSFLALLILLTGTLSYAEKVKVLILTGANNHNWQVTTPVLVEILESSGSFKVDVETEPNNQNSKSLAEYDVLLSNWNTFGKTKPAPWSEEFKNAYVDFIRKGGGHIVVHAGSSSYYDWDDYQEFCIATWKDGTGHKKPHEFNVRISENEHVITHSMRDFRTFDELWFRPFVQPGAKVLAESYSKTTGEWEPTAFVANFGQGRCFTLLLGHSAETMKNGNFQLILNRGALWVAGKLHNDSQNVRN